MNTKVANVIAVELGVLIAILTWLAFSHFPAAQPRAAAEMQEDPGDSFTTVAPVFKSRNQPAPALDLRVDPPQAQRRIEEAAPVEQDYVQEYANQPYLSSGLQDESIAGSSLYYSPVEPEPVLTPDYYVGPVEQFVVYPQRTQIIIVSNARSFANRCRPKPRCNTVGIMFPNRRPDGGQPHLRGPGPVSRPPTDPHGGGVVAHRKANPRPLPPAQGLRVNLNR